MTTLSDIGLILHEERKRQGLSIADIMAATHISRISLTAIEEGREDALPHKVYAKGFIRNYAQVLGLDAEELLAGYKVESDEEPIKPTPSTITPPEPRPTRIGATLVVVLFGVLIGVITAGYILYSNGMSEEPPLRAETPPAPTSTPSPTPGTASGVPGQTPTGAPAISAEDPSIEMPPVAAITEEPISEQVDPPSSTLEVFDQPMEPAAPTITDTPTEAPLTAPQAESTLSVTPNPTAQSKPQTPQVTAEAIPEATTPIAETAEPIPTPVPADGVNVAVVTATEPCWMQARYANGRVQEAILRPGDTLELRFADGIQLRLGNAGGVSIALNGAPVSIDAQSGEVRTLRLP